MNEWILFNFPFESIWIIQRRHHYRLRDAKYRNLFGTPFLRRHGSSSWHNCYDTRPRFTWNLYVRQPSVQTRAIKGPFYPSFPRDPWENEQLNSAVSFGLVLYGMMLYINTVWLWYDTIGYGMVWYDRVWYASIWHVWYYMIRYE